MTSDESNAPPPVPGLPLFCPACRKPYPPGRPVCTICAGRLVLQGYCGVCERAWLQVPGTLCPKHDVELISEPPDSLLSRPDLAGEAWVRVAAYAHPHEAEAARIRLDAEGIPALLDGHRMSMAYPGQLATGGSRLLVPAVYLQDARILLSQSWSEPVPPEDAIQGDEWLDEEEHAARRPSVKVQPRIPAPGGIAYGLAVLLAVILLLLAMNVGAP